jgi:hypothetical protein
LNHQKKSFIVIFYFLYLHISLCKKNRLENEIITNLQKKQKKQINLFTNCISDSYKLKIWKYKIQMYLCTRNNKLAKLFQPTFQMHRKRLFNI